jgi:hypothetical protein
MLQRQNRYQQNEKTQIEERIPPHMSFLSLELFYIKQEKTVRNRACLHRLICA